MRSTSDSKSASDSGLVARARNLSLHFDLRLRPPTSWREIFALWLWRRDKSASARTRIHAIHDVSFEIRQGDRIGLLGRNGSGKTSLCRTLVGIYEPCSGTLERRKEARSVFGAFPLIEPELSGRENARLLARLFFPKKYARDELVADALEFSELGALLDMPVKFYSSGMGARLVLSLVSAAPTDLLILDEVFDGADLFFQQKIGERMRELIRRSGAVVFVSHSLEQIRQNCNRIWIYDKGEILFDGGVEQGISLYLRFGQSGSATPA